jgi:Na+-transporting NADH:ubiquinone oxidoreductase subunit NqrB
MLRVVRGFNLEFLCELVKRVLKKKDNIRLFFTSRSATMDMVLQSAVPVIQTKLSIQRWVTYSKEIINKSKVIPITGHEDTEGE